MANIENIVKVMNFHSLLRVDKSKRKAEMFFNLGEKLNKTICEIYYNKNLKLDKKIIFENPKGDIINIYIANDLGFCGNFNSLITKSLNEDKGVKKIIIGKKINYLDKSLLFKIEKERFESDFSKIQELIYTYINEYKLKEVNIIYNHYYNTNDIRFEKIKLFPVKLEMPEGLNLDVDFVSETSINNILSGLLSYYICYKIRIAEENSLASENIMRERITHEAITKITNRNQEKAKAKRKANKYKSFKKQLGNYRKVDDEDDR